MLSISRRQPQPCRFSDQVHPLLQRVFAARGAISDDHIDYRLNALLPPDTLKGLPEAVALLITAAEQQQRILIVGDFDADGATGCALSVLALRAMGLPHVDFLVPNRFEYGYGLSEEIVEVAKTYHPDIIITVDNGIASVAGVAKAKALGINVLVTDHHLPPDILPAADAIVNPNQPGCPFPSKNLAGVGVMFYLLSALRSALREIKWFTQQGITEPVMANYLDLVALGTVADVVPLDQNNRILVAQGLRRVRAGYTRPGILALLQVAGKDHQRVDSSDFGFILGPRLNAAGRLDDISIGIQCLLTDDTNIACELATQLDTLNRDRRTIESLMQREALQHLADINVDSNNMPAAICLYDESWHQGVVGILASRIKEKFHRPVIAFAPADRDKNTDEIKGSARSIPNLHIRDLLEKIATQNPDILQKFGGHAMAAGLSLNKKNYPAFTVLFEQAVNHKLSAADFSEVLLSDGTLLEEECTLPMALAIQQSGPWGQQFPEPLFDGNFFIVNQRIVGDKHIKLELAFDRQSMQRIDAIMFNADLQQWPSTTTTPVRLVYQLAINVYRNRESIQLIVKHIVSNPAVENH